MASEQHSALKYQRIIRAVRAIPWAIMPQRLADILDVLTMHAQGGTLTADEIRDYIGIPDRLARVEHVPIHIKATPGGYFVPDDIAQVFLESPGTGERMQAAKPGAAVRAPSIAVLGVRGILANRIEEVDDISGPGGTSVERLSARFREAMADDNVRGILFDIDSPGGAVQGIPEFAAEIREARGTKPIRAVADSLAASAAYWIASATDEISVTPSGEVGSIGVFAAHSDISGLLEKRGERVTLIHAGPFKVEGNPFEPLSDEGQEFIQARVDETYTEFLEAVAAGRGVDASIVEADFGEGRVVGSKQALAAGMVDRIETRDSAITRLREAARGSARGAGRSAREFAFL